MVSGRLAWPRYDGRLMETAKPEVLSLRLWQACLLLQRDWLIPCKLKSCDFTHTLPFPRCAMRTPSSKVSPAT